LDGWATGNRCKTTGAESMQSSSFKVLLASRLLAFGPCESAQQLVNFEECPQALHVPHESQPRLVQPAWIDTYLDIADPPLHQFCLIVRKLITLLHSNISLSPHTNTVASKTRSLSGRTSLNFCWDVETTVERTLPHFMPTPMLHVAVNIIGEHNELEESLAEPYIEEFEDISHVLEQAGLPTFQEPRSVINWGEVDNRRKYDETIPIRSLHLLRRAYAIMKAVRSALSRPAPGISCSHTSSTSPTPSELKRDAIAYWACR
jgi:hypothetical protein